MKISTLINRIFCFLFIAFYSLIARAGNFSAKEKEISRKLLLGIPDRSNSPLESNVGSLVYVIEEVEKLAKALAIAGGVAMILFSVKKYNKYRMDPITNSLRSVLLLFIIGAALIVISFIPFHF